MRTASVRALQRGLMVLEYFNRWDGSTITDIMRVLGAPYATTYRLLKTLCDLGLLTKGNRRGQYWLTARVKSLSAGYRCDSWISQHAIGIIETLAEGLQWPAFLLLPRGQEMVVRARSRLSSPMIDGEIPSGTTSSMAATAAGIAFLAFSRSQTARLAPGMARKLSRARKSGFAQVPETHPSIVQIAVPIMVRGEPRGALMIRANKLALMQTRIATLCAEAMVRAAGQLAPFVPAQNPAR